MYIDKNINIYNEKLIYFNYHEIYFFILYAFGIVKLRIDIYIFFILKFTNLRNILLT
jgi:hypothetical protein